MRHRVFLEVLIVMGAAAAVLYVLSGLTNRDRWHPSVLSDEVGYVSVAKNLLDNGEMRSGVIYTSTLKQDTARNYPYMPGHYLAVALAFLLGGVGRAQAIAPSLVSYCLAAGCTYLTGRKLYGRSAGIAAAAVFAVLPACLAYSFTAMSELTFIAAVSVAFCAYVHLRPSLRVWLGPVLLVLPFLFRETGALLVIPMAGLIVGAVPLLQRISLQRWRDVIVFYALSIGLLAALYVSPLCGPRPSLMKMMLFDVPPLDIYYSATAEDHIPEGVGAWMKAVEGNIVRNFKALRVLSDSQPAGMESGCLGAVLLGMVLSFWVSWRRRDATAFACGLMALTAIVLIMALYAVSGFRGMRNLMFVWPILALPVGAWLAEIVSRAIHRPAAMMPLIVAETALVAVSLSLATRMLGVFASNDKQDDAAARFVMSVNHNPRRVLASTVSMGLPYLVRRQSASWAFLPLNRPTMALLLRDHDVGTVIVPQGLTTLDYHQLAILGFVFDRELVFQGQQLSIYRRPPKADHPAQARRAAQGKQPRGPRNSPRPRARP